MASKADMAALKELLESLHEKVDALSAELQALRGQGAPASEGVAPVEAASDAAESVVQPETIETNPALAVVLDFVAAALVESDEDCWAELERLTHSGALLAPRSLDHLKAFSWKKLRVNARRYFASRDDIRADRVEPLKIDENTTHVKVFIAHGKGASSPLTVARDSESGGDWRIQTCSL